MKETGSVAANPLPPAAKRPSGQQRYRIRQGDHRIIFPIQDEPHTVHVVKKSPTGEMR